MPLPCFLVGARLRGHDGGGDAGMTGPVALARVDAPAGCDNPVPLSRPLLDCPCHLIPSA